jgi:hypothetical protein
MRYNYGQFQFHPNESSRPANASKRSPQQVCFAMGMDLSFLAGRLLAIQASESLSGYVQEGLI